MSTNEFVRMPRRCTLHNTHVAWYCVALTSAGNVLRDVAPVDEDGRPVKPADNAPKSEGDDAKRDALPASAAAAAESKGVLEEKKTPLGEWTAPLFVAAALGNVALCKL